MYTPRTRILADYKLHKILLFEDFLNEIDANDDDKNNNFTIGNFLCWICDGNNHEFYLYSIKSAS